MTLLDQARRALTDLALRAEWLEDSLLNGTPRPYRPPVLTIEAREAADAAARQERHERVDIAPGDSPDPFAFEVSDLRTSVLFFADAMADEIAQAAGVDRMPDASWDSDPRPYLDYIRQWLVQADEAHPDQEIANRVTGKAERYTARADALLGHALDGFVIPRACPFCEGRTAAKPTGGAYTLRIRLGDQRHGKDTGRWWLKGAVGPLSAGELLMVEHPAITDQTLIVCEGGMCEPGEGMYWTKNRGNPAWLLLNEYEWLAACMEARDKNRICPCGNPVPTSARPGRPARYCSDECRRTANAERMAAARAA